MEYKTVNKVKTSFCDVYNLPTPHAYIKMMAKNGYEIGEQARPYCIAAAELLNDKNNKAWPTNMLDIGCSYGMGSAFVKYNCSFDELVAFFLTRAPKELNAAAEAMRAWLNATLMPQDIRCVGIDNSEPAINFAIKAGLLDGGIARNFEDLDVIPNEEEIAWLRSCNLLISTGAIGYVTEKTIEHVLRHAGKDHPGEYGPLTVFTIMRMFDPQPIKDLFSKYCYKFEKVKGVMLPQRNFTNKKEQKSVLKVLHDKGLDTSEWEDGGKYFAELFIAAPGKHFPEFFDIISKTSLKCAGEQHKTITYVCR